MRSFLKDLDVCTTKKISSSQLNFGDIVVYKSASGENLAVHRVLSVNRKKACALIKGDNIPSKFGEEIPFSDIKEKVIEVKKEGKVFNLESLPLRFAGKIIAFLSKCDLTPLLFKRRFVDPLLLGIARNPLYVFFRKLFYKDISFMCTKKDDRCEVYAFVGKTKSAKATLELRKDGYVLSDSYIRYRDRNPVFEKKFTQKLQEYLSSPRLSAAALAKAEKRESNKKVDLYPALDFSFSSLTDEEKLVILCSRVNMPEDLKDQAKTLIISGNLGWDYFLKLAKTYKVTPLVHKHFQSFLDEIPEHVKQNLREQAGFIFASNIRETENLRYITKLFKEKDLEALFIKGAHLMIDVYKERGLRLFTDIDVLAKDFKKTERVLLEEGFEPYESQGIFSRYRSQRMYSLDEKIYLDVHKDFIGRMLHNRIQGMDKKRIWENKRRITFGDVEISALDPVHTLLYQCLHLAVQHGFFGLLWYVDIHELVMKYKDEMDWGEVLKLASEYKVKRPLYYSLLFTKRMLGTPVPDHVLEKLKVVERGLDRWVFEKIKRKNVEIDYFAELAMFDSVWDTTRFVILSFMAYPYLIFHFFRIFGRMLRKRTVPA
ncbi:MAG: nucleotidyltransferase family protein [Candidatus Omnitrophota bacterium]